MPTQTAERAETYIKHALNGAVAFAIAGATFFILAHLVSTEPFGHDDAVYLAKAREWMTGIVADQWGIYRPVGMSLVAWVLLQFGETEHLMRMFGVFTGALTSGLIFLFFRSISNLWSALSITLLATTSYVFLLQAPQFLNDIASSGALFAVLWVIYLHYKSEGWSNTIFLAAPFSALAFYLRYGVVETLAVIAVCSFFFLIPKFLQTPSSDFRRLALTAVLTFVLFAPHFIYSGNVTKKLLGVLLSAGDAAHRAYIGEGLVQYIRWLPDQLGGWPIGIAAILGTGVSVALLFVPRLRRAFPALAWTGSIGLGTFILTGLLVHAEPRYVYFPMVLLAAVGVLGIYYAAARISSVLSHVFILAVCVVSIVFGVAHYRDLGSYFTQREQSPLSIAYSMAHETIRKDNANAGGCSLWVVRFQPRASWYTACEIYDFNNPVQFRRQLEAQPNLRAYSIVVTDLQNAQVDEKSASGLGIILNEINRIRLPSSDVIVYRIIDVRKMRPVFTEQLPVS